MLHDNREEDNAVNGDGLVTHAWGDWQVTPYLGFTARWKYLFATARSYLKIESHESGTDAYGNDCFGCGGMTDRSAYQITVGIQVPFR